MKTKFFAAGCLMLAAAASMASAQSVLILNGSPVSKAVTHLSFDGDNVIVNYADASTTIHGPEEVAISFTAQPSSIGELSFSRLSVAVGSELRVEGVADGTPLRVYDVNGRAVAATRAAGESATIDLSAHPAGVYCLMAGNEVVKFVKR